jgi:hypothetical protein
MVASPPGRHPVLMQSTNPSPLAIEDRLFYVESSIPPGLTVDEYRRARSGRRPSRWSRLKRLAGTGAAPAHA